MNPHIIVWFRQNLRIRDNRTLCTAADYGLPIIGIWTDNTPPGNTKRTHFHRQSAGVLAHNLTRRGIPLLCADNTKQLTEYAAFLNARAVIADESHTFDDKLRDNTVWHTLDRLGIALHYTADRTVFDKTELISAHGTAYTDFPSYRQAWLERYRTHRPAEDTRFDHYTQTLPDTALPDSPIRLDGNTVPALQNGGEDQAWQQWQTFLDKAGMYDLFKDFPSRRHTGMMSAYLSAGCISPRLLAQEAAAHRLDSWLDGIIKRDFFQQNARQPTPTTSDNSNTVLQQHWQQGTTGIPIIDAAMRCLSHTGYLHPALRRLCAAFFLNTLKQPPKDGAAWFARCQTDFDAAVNLGNWQYAGQTADIITASRNLDPDGAFIRRHIPELAHLCAQIIHTPWQSAGNIDTHGYPAVPIIRP